MASSVGTIVVNEVLCYTVGYYPKVTRTQLKAMLSCFYNDDELSLAKDTLISDIGKLNDTLLPRFPKRKGDNRVKVVVDDIVEIISIADEKKVISSLPRYAALDLMRIPCVKLEDMDLFVLTQKVESLEVKAIGVEGLITRLSGIEEALIQVKNAVSGSAGAGVPVTTLTLDRGITLKDDCVEDSSTSPPNVVACGDPSTSWADAARPSISPGTEFVKVVSKKHRASALARNNPPSSSIASAGSDVQQRTKSAAPSRRILGTAACSGSGLFKSGVSLLKKAVFHVDNLYDECSVDTLKEFLANQNIGVLSCFPAKSWMRGSNVGKVSSFRVCVAAADKDLFTNPSLWPEDVIIRAWLFTSNKNDVEN